MDLLGLNKGLHFLYTDRQLLHVILHDFCVICNFTPAAMEHARSTAKSTSPKY